MATPGNDIVNGTGTIPTAQNLGGSIETLSGNPQKIIVTGVDTNKLVRQGDSIYANDELRKVKSMESTSQTLTGVSFWEVES